MIFRINKLYVSVSTYFFIMLLWVVMTQKVKAFALCIIALILHEIGHIAMIYYLGEKINVFYILPFGFCCRLKNQNKVIRKNMIKILLAGPVASICAAGLLIFWTKEFALVNFILGIFNLLPVGSLDGGRLSKFFE